MKTAIVFTGEKPRARESARLCFSGCRRTFSHSRPAAFTIPTSISTLSFIQGAGHGGSHPHLAHEFVTALVEGRDPHPNAVQSANWTCVGILAHESAMAGGEKKLLPEFTLQ